MRAPRHGERGQTFPVWLFGILTAMALLFFLINYANVVRWQIRAQSAADSAASGAISTQATQWNQMLVLLYSAGVEEYRIRKLIDMMLLTIRSSGGCWEGGTALCNADYQSMRTAYLKAVQRYTVDVELMQKVSSLGYADYKNDATQLVNLFQMNCGTSQGGDCSFRYTLNDFSTRTSNLQDVQQDGLGFSFAPGQAPTVKQDLQPVQLEVVVCHDVPPLIPSFFGLNFGNFRAIGRAAATTVLTTQEWLQPGSISNTWDGAPFQPVEYYDAYQAPQLNGYDWYSVTFSGNDTTTSPSTGELTEQFQVNEFTTFTGWWSSIPEKPYSGSLPGSIACS